MSKRDPRGRPSADRTSLYDEITGKILAELEAGRLPWVQPWDGSKLESGLPRNAGTGRRYSGINVLILWTVFERGFGTQGWLTYRQAQALGGNVRKGEAGATICYAHRFTPKDRDQQPITEPGDEHRRQVADAARLREHLPSHFLLIGEGPLLRGGILRRRRKHEQTEQSGASHGVSSFWLFYESYAGAGERGRGGTKAVPGRREKAGFAPRSPTRKSIWEERPGLLPGPLLNPTCGGPSSP